MGRKLRREKAISENSLQTKKYMFTTPNIAAIESNSRMQWHTHSPQMEKSQKKMILNS